MNSEIVKTTDFDLLLIDFDFSFKSQLVTNSRFEDKSTQAEQ